MLERSIASERTASPLAAGSFCSAPGSIGPNHVPQQRPSPVPFIATYATRASHDRWSRARGGDILVVGANESTRRRRPKASPPFSLHD
eukprot:scaffold205382_cov33-Tisochrysis_lutea.AAC.1